jgi:hypothetical protein
MPYADYAESLARSKYRYRLNRVRRLEQSAHWVEANRKRKNWLDQRATSKKRGVKFNLTYEEYVEFWGDDFHLKGRKNNQLCMCRYGDEGAYEVGNIYKETMLVNKGPPRSHP